MFIRYYNVQIKMPFLKPDGNPVLGEKMDVEEVCQNKWSFIIEIISLHWLIMLIWMGHSSKQRNNIGFELRLVGWGFDADAFRAAIIKR